MVKFRPFGTHEADINFNFVETSRIRLTLELLTQCQLDQKTFDEWSQLIGSERIFYLWQLVWTSRNERQRTIEISLVCGRPECREGMLIDFTEEEIDSLRQGPSDGSLRAPSSREVMELMSIGAEKWLDRWRGLAAIEVVEQKLAQLDPLVAFSCWSQCPQCELEQTFAIDLESLALNELRHIQDRLIFDIQVLARHFHWRENEILALPQWRRSHYLRLLRSEERVTL